VNKLDRYIKTRSGDKVLMRVTSINVEAKHLAFLKTHNLNLSALIRDYLTELMSETIKDPK
jgi:hypothetical protein